MTAQAKRTRPRQEPVGSIRERALKRGREPKSELVHVDDWNADVKVVEMGAGERARMLGEAIKDETGKIDPQVLYRDLVLACAYDPETGEKVFEPADAAELMLGAHGDAFDTIVGVATRINGISGDSLKDAEKNS